MITCKLKSKYIFTLLFSVLFLLIFISEQRVSAISSDTKVYDYDKLFTEIEVSTLEENLKTLSEESEVDIIIITTSNLNGSSRKTYLEDFYDSIKPGYEGQYGSTTLMLLNMDPNDRGVEIQGYKNAEYAINNQVIENIIDTIYNDLADGNYADAVLAYAEEISKYMTYSKENSSNINTTPHNNYNNNSNNNNYNNNYNNNFQNYSSSDDTISEFLKDPLIQFVASLIIAGISVAVMAFNAGGRKTTTSRTYLDSNKAFVPISQDNYIRTTTTKVKKPSDNNNNHGGGSSGGGRSSGGHSHSGGGRSF